jgi:hypothetical protein
MNRPVGSSRMIASSSQLSHRRVMTSTTSAFSASASTSDGSVRLPKCATSASVRDGTASTPARPRLA